MLWKKLFRNFLVQKSLIIPRTTKREKTNGKLKLKVIHFQYKNNWKRVLFDFLFDRSLPKKHTKFCFFKFIFMMRSSSVTRNERELWLEGWLDWSSQKCAEYAIHWFMALVTFLISEHIFLIWRIGGGGGRVETAAKQQSGYHINTTPDQRSANFFLWKFYCFQERGFHAVLTRQKLQILGCRGEGHAVPKTFILASWKYHFPRYPWKRFIAHTISCVVKRCIILYTVYRIKRI